MDFLNYVNGQLVTSQSGQRSDVFSIFDSSQNIGTCVVSEPMDFILALQGSKKYLPELKQVSVIDRLLFVEKILNFVSENIEYMSEAEAQFQGLSAEFMKNKVLVPFIQYYQKEVFYKSVTSKNHDSQADILEVVTSSLSEDKLKNKIPTGIIVISAMATFCLKETLERVLPALIAGNVCLVRIPEQSAMTAKLLAEIFAAVGLPVGAVQVLIGSDSLFEMMALHPSIAGVSFIGDSQESAPLLAKLSENYKKVQFQGSSKNSVIVLADFDFKNRMPEILEPLLMGMGRSYWNGARIFIVESIRDAFVESLKVYLNQLTPAKNCHSTNCYWPLFQAEQALLERYTSEISSEHGKTIKSEESSQHPVFTIDLTNCSTKQQDSLRVPLFIISTVKYQHEIAKWVNTSYLAHSAVVFGPVEKSEKISSQLEVGLVQTNQWQIITTDCILGLKNSSFGITDLKPEGSFFSGIKKLTPT